MKQKALLDEIGANIPTCEWYQLEKKVFSLSSPHRPKVENTLKLCFRQTSFPTVLK